MPGLLLRLFPPLRKYTLATVAETPERFLKSFLKRLVTKIVRQGRRMAFSRGVISRSMAMGMVVGFSPTVGLQMAICVAIAVAANRIRGLYTFDTVIALIGSLVVNPLTMVPTYTLYYFIGCRMMTCSSMVELENDQQIQSMLTNLGEGSMAILLGSVPFMIAGVPLGYALGWLIERFLERRADRKRARKAALAKLRLDRARAVEARG